VPLFTSAGLGRVILVLVLVLRIWSCLHHCRKQLARQHWCHVTMPNLIILRQTVPAYRYGDPSENWTPRIPPFKVTEGHRNRHGSIGYTRDFPLVTHNNHGHLSYRLWDKRRFWLKIAHFAPPPPVQLTSPLRGSPWNFLMVAHKKLESCPTRGSKKFDNMCIRLNTTLQREGQTDGRTDRRK